MHVDNTKQSPAAISICYGSGGLERGFHSAFKILQWPKPKYASYVEIEAVSVFNLVAQMEQGMVDPAAIWSNLKTFPASQFYQRIDWLIGGYPCQGESTAGSKEYEKFSGWLWPYVKKCTGAIKPLGCFFENVDNHLNGSFPIVYRDLRKMGYRVEAGIYSAAEAGAPHQRNRLFILALANGVCMGTKGIFRSIQGTTATDEGQAHKWQWNGTKPFNGGKTMAYDQCDRKWEGSEIHQSKQFNENGNNRSPFISLAFSEGYKRRPSKEPARWPKPPGSDQWNWEHPRQAESSMGCTINGYNFREDLLRMLGNAVVEQTAELAFIDLLKKHFNNNK